MLLLGLFAPQAWAQTHNIGGLNYTLDATTHTATVANTPCA